MAGLQQETVFLPPDKFGNYNHHLPSETATVNRQPFHYHHHQNSKNFNNTAGEYIPLRHGSPELRRNYVYPSQTFPIPAFQMPTHQSPKYNPLQDMKTISRASPLAVKSPKLQDSSFSVTDADEIVAKISAMFPTVSDTHIRMLMNNCRYMKSVFPKAEETIILEILQNNDNNIQKTTEILKEMGYQKKDTVKAAQQKMQTKLQQEKNENDRKEKTPTVIIPKLKTTEEKAAIKSKLKQKYKDVAEQLITMALESVDYNENRANQILEIMVQEDNEKSNQPSTSQVVEEENSSENDLKPPGLPVSQSRQSIKSLIKSEKIDKNNTYNRIFEKDSTQYKSTNMTESKGPNPNLTKGPNDNLLLLDYLEREGPNKNYWQGPQNLAKGPNRNLLGNRSYQPCGSNPELRKGPQIGLAKGSIFSQFKSIVVGESYGK